MKIWRLVILFTLLIVCTWVVIKSNKLSSRVVAYEQEYAIIERGQLMDVVEQIQELQAKKRDICDKIKTLDISPNANDVFYCGK